MQWEGDYLQDALQVNCAALTRGPGYRAPYENQAMQRVQKSTRTETKSDQSLYICSSGHRSLYLSVAGMTGRTL